MTGHTTVTVTPCKYSGTFNGQSGKYPDRTVVYIGKKIVWNGIFKEIKRVCFKQFRFKY